MGGNLSLPCLYYTFFHSGIQCSEFFGSGVLSLLFQWSASQEVKMWCPWICILQHRSKRTGQHKYKFCCNSQCVPNVMGFGWVIQCILSSLLNTGSSISSPLASSVCFADHTDCRWQLHNWWSSQCSAGASSSLDPCLEWDSGFLLLLKCKPELLILLLFCMVKCGNWNLLVSSMMFTACGSGTEVIIVILPEIHSWTALPWIAKSQNRTEQSERKLYLNTRPWQAFQYYVLELKFWRFISIGQVWVWVFV